MPSSLTPGSSDIACVQLRDADAAFAEIRAARHSQDSRNPFHAGPGFRGFTGSHLLRPVRLLAPLDGSDRVSPATGGFYIQASDGSVTLPVAGYDYNSLWTPLLAGLSPAGMAASLAAPDPVETRVAATPDMVKKYKSLGADVVVQAGAGPRPASRMPSSKPRA